MRLFIVRHGKAEAEAPTGLDRDRQLKPKGQRQAQFLGARVAEMERPPQRILASGWDRAQQTATIIAETLQRPLRHEEILEPGNPASSIVSMLQANAGVGSLMLVGHNPQCVDVLAVLTRALCPGDAIMRTGEAAVLDIRLSQPIGSGRLVERIRLDEKHAVQC